MRLNDLFKYRFLMWNLTFLLAFSVLSAVSLESVYARKPGVAGEAEVKAQRFDAAVSKLEAIEIKNADEWYLLGRAYMGAGKKREAYQAWTEALHINEKLTKRKKWTFLFPPNKPLKGKQKKRLKEDFEDEYKELNSMISRMKNTQAKDLKNKASRTRIDAKKKDAKEKQLNKMAAAKTKTISSKQRMADRKSKTRQNTHKNRRSSRSGGSSMIGKIVIGLIIGLVLFAIIFGKRSRSRSRRSAHFYDVGYDDDVFRDGPFYYRGRHYSSHDLFHRDHGYHYTNRMYRDNYDRWGTGQAYDEALDDDIHHDIDQREDLYNAAAQEGYEADEMRADAEHYEQDAHELEQDINDGDEAAGFFNDGHEFGDDEFADDEAHSDGYDDEFADDEDYDDGDYDDGDYDDGDFEDDSDS